MVVEWQPQKTRTSTSFLVPEVNTARAASPGKSLLTSSASGFWGAPGLETFLCLSTFRKLMSYLLKRDFHFSANPCSFLLYLHFYLPSTLGVYVSNRSVFLSHLSNVGTVVFICPYCIQAGRGTNPARDDCDTQRCPRLTWAGAGHPQPTAPAVAVWQGRELGLGNAWFPARGRLGPGVQRSRDTPDTCWHMVSPHLPPHGTSFLEVPLPSLPILVHSPTPHPGFGAFSALLVRSGISFPSGLPQTKRELHRSCNHK